MRFFQLAGVLLGLSTVCAAQNGSYWNYEGHTGPLVWGKLDPAYQACSKGHQQSPLDIRGARLNKALTPIEFHYIAGPMTLVNTGRGIVAHVDPGSWMEVGGVRYRLEEMDFHRPSEHPVRGRLSDMEVDLIHRSDDGKEAIVAVRLDEDQGRGNPNALVSTLWNHLPTKPDTQARVTDMLSAGGLLPGDRGYWTYVGSEVTPPCAEGVRWFVFEQDLSISREQLRAFTSLFRMNTRPVQDPHGRKIEADE
jgi:carbonic anhydrase